MNSSDSTLCKKIRTLVNNCDRKELRHCSIANTNLPVGFIGYPPAQYEQRQCCNKKQHDDQELISAICDNYENTESVMDLVSINDKYLEDKYLEDKYLEDKYLEDKYLEDTYLEDTYLEDKSSIDIYDILTSNMRFNININMDYLFWVKTQTSEQHYIVYLPSAPCVCQKITIRNDDINYFIISAGFNNLIYGDISPTSTINANSKSVYQLYCADNTDGIINWLIINVYQAPSIIGQPSTPIII